MGYCKVMAEYAVNCRKLVREERSHIKNRFISRQPIAIQNLHRPAIVSERIDSSDQAGK